MFYTTLADLKLFIGETGTANDALLTDLITQTEAFIGAYIGGRDLELQTYTEEMHDGEDKYIFLFNFPIDMGATFTAETRSGSLSSPIWTPYTDNDYIIYDDSGMVLFPAGTPNGNLNLRFTYDAGYAVAPEELTLIANQITALTFNKRNAQGIKSEAVEGSKIEYLGGGSTGEGGGLIHNLTAEQALILNKYKDYSLGNRL